MVLASREDNDGGDNCADEKCEVDLNIGEEDEPFVSRSFLELACRFSAANAASGIFSSNACECEYFLYSVRHYEVHTNAQEESIHDKRCDKAIWSPTTIRARSKRCKQNDDDSRHEQ